MPGSSAIHVIRLRDPWERELVTEAIGISAPILPANETESNAHIAVGIRFRRRFGLPTGLMPEDQIDLVIERIFARGHVLLNHALLGELVAGEKSVRFSLCGRLQTRNLLLLEFLSQAGIDDSHLRLTGSEQALADFAGEVRLEIFARTA